jgi:hypothetical protein
LLNFHQNRGLGLLYQLYDDFLVFTLALSQAIDVILHLADHLLNRVDIAIMKRVLVTHQLQRSQHSLSISLNFFNSLIALLIFQIHCFRAFSQSG